MKNWELKYQRVLFLWSPGKHCLLKLPQGESELNSARRRGTGPRDTWQHRNSPQQGGEVRGYGTHGSSGAHLYREVWSEASACVAARRCTTCSFLDLNLVCRGTRSSWCRQRPSGPPRERLRTHRWGQFFGTPLSYLDLFTRQSTVRPPST
jgi:hypothetical protein